MIISLIVSLILTLIIEIAISLILGIRKCQDIFVIICANICTNPIVVYVSNCFKLLNKQYIYIIVVIILEILAVIVEFLIYKKYLKFERVKPLMISIINNAISFSIGLLINNFL